MTRKIFITILVVVFIIIILGNYKPIFFKRKIDIDTACVYGGYLSALEIQGDKIVKAYQVGSRRENALMSVI
jgi:hypothetical protein